MLLGEFVHLLNWTNANGNIQERLIINKNIKQKLKRTTDSRIFRARMIHQKYSALKGLIDVSKVNLETFLTSSSIDIVDHLAVKCSRLHDTLPLC